MTGYRVVPSPRQRLAMEDYHQTYRKHVPNGDGDDGMSCDAELLVRENAQIGNQNGNFREGGRWDIEEL